MRIPEDDLPELGAPAAVDLRAELTRVRRVLTELSGGAPVLLADLRRLLIESLEPGLELAALATDEQRLALRLHALKGTCSAAGLTDVCAATAAFEQELAALSTGERVARGRSISVSLAAVLADLRGDP